MARIIGFWARIGNKLVPVIDDFDGLILPPEGSILFEDGSYGIRVSGGTLQFKNKNGSWQNFGTGGGGGGLDYNNFSAVSPIIYDGAGEFSLSVPAQASLAKADTAVQPGDLKTVATTGDYADLTNKPALKTVATTGDYDDLTNKPALKTVATTGDYNDLTNKPTLGSLAAKSAVSVSDINATGIGATKYLKGDGTWDTPAGGGGGGMSGFNLAGDSGTSQTINDGDTMSIKGSTGISTVASATDTITINLDTTLQSLSAYNTNGVMVQTGADTFTGRTITGTANQVIVSNGNGVAGNPVLSLPQSIDTSDTPRFQGLNIGHASDTTLTRSSAGVLALEGVLMLTESSTNEVTNKRNKPRTNSTTSSSTLTPSLSTANVFYRTTQTVALTINAPTGTPVIGETIAIYVNSAGAQTLTINSTFKVYGSAFPATTTAGKTFLMTAQYNGTDWDTLWANKI